MPSRPIVKTNGVRGPQGDPGPAGPSGTGGLPAGGTDGQVVTKSGAGAVWAAVNGLPNGGTAGQALLKNSSTNGDASWGDSAAVAPSTHAATSKTTLVDADEIPVADSAASYGLKKGLLSNLYAYIAGKLNTAGIAKLTTARTIDGVAFDGTGNITVIAAGTHAAASKTTPVDADAIPLVDSAASNGLKQLTMANLRAWVEDAVQDALDLKQDVATMQDDVLDLFPGLTMTTVYDTTASAWPTLDTDLATDARAAWLPAGADESTPPQVTTGPGTWVRNT